MTPVALSEKLRSGRFAEGSSMGGSAESEWSSSTGSSFGLLRAPEKYQTDIVVQIKAYGELGAFLEYPLPLYRWGDLAPGYRKFGACDLGTCIFNLWFVTVTHWILRLGRPSSCHPHGLNQVSTVSGWSGSSTHHGLSSEWTEWAICGLHLSLLPSSVVSDLPPELVVWSIKAVNRRHHRPHLSFLVNFIRLLVYKIVDRAVGLSERLRSRRTRWCNCLQAKHA